MNIALCSLLIAALPTGGEWQDNQALSYGKEPTRAAFSSFSSEAKALKILPEYSDRTISLDSDKDWKFHWAPRPSARPIRFYEPSFDVRDWETIKVPCSWQALGAGRLGTAAGWGTALYTNVPYPFQKDVPGGSRVMLDPPEHFTNYSARNPVGSYRRDFTVPKYWNNDEIFLKFDGVDSFFYLWVNGKYVGFSKDSRSPAEFNVTKFIKRGEVNTVALEVYRYSDGSYLEDQDMFRLSGIFRRTWLIARPKERIHDFRLKAVPVVENAFSGDWTLTVDAEADGQITTKVYDWHDHLVASSNEKTFVVPGVKPWSAEAPNCYKIVISNGREFVSTVFGFRVSEMREEADGTIRYYLNGQKIKLKGANRHETDPMFGHFVPMWRHEQDVRQLKEANCNCVRNSHYPQDDYWYYLCDVNGIYLVDEANVESHGYGYGEMSLSHQPSWEKATVDRNVSMVKRNFNHPSVVIWSLGNEAGPGENFVAANKAIKALDPVRPIHYERDWTVADMDGCQYPGVPWTFAKAASSTNSVKPFYISEYAHNMGNAMGNLKDYQDAIESSDVILGATIWDWVDQGLYLDKNGKRIIGFGGDFGDKPNDGFFCMNGCVLSDRALEPGYWEIKHVYQNWTARASDDFKTVIVRNKNYFVGSTGIACTWKLYRNGHSFAAGSFALDNLRPQQEASYPMPPVVKNALEQGGVVSLRVKFTKNGAEIAADQIDFPVEKVENLFVDVPKAKNDPVKTTRKEFTVDTAKARYTFSRETGLLTQIDEKELGGAIARLKAPMTLDVFRTPSANESSFGIKLGEAWAAWGLMDPVGKAKEFSKIAFADDGTASFRALVEWTFPKGKLVEGFNDAEVKITDIKPPRALKIMTSMHWTIYPDGTARCVAKIRPFGRRLELPRVGFSMILNGAEHEVKWLGRGPFENYSDRKSGAFIGEWKAEAKDFFVPYCRNESSGDREETYGVSLDKLTFRTLGKPFAFGVNPYTPLELLSTVHPQELAESKKTVFGVYAATRGLGGASCGPAPIERDIIRTDEDYELDFTISFGDNALSPRKAGEVNLLALPEREVVKGAKVIACSSREPGEGEPEHLVDGDYDTIWHTQYGTTMGNFPHSLVVELDEEVELKGLRFLQRQIGVNGMIKDFTLELSQDGVNWCEPMKGSLLKTREMQEVHLSEPYPTKFYRFTALNNHFGNDYGSLAEIEIIK